MKNTLVWGKARCTAKLYHYNKRYVWGNTIQCYDMWRGDRRFSNHDWLKFFFESIYVCTPSFPLILLQYETKVWAISICKKPKGHMRKENSGWSRFYIKWDQKSQSPSQSKKLTLNSMLPKKYNFTI